MARLLDWKGCWPNSSGWTDPTLLRDEGGEIPSDERGGASILLRIREKGYLKPGNGKEKRSNFWIWDWKTASTVLNFDPNQNGFVCDSDKK